MRPFESDFNVFRGRQRADWLLLSALRDGLPRTQRVLQLDTGLNISNVSRGLRRLVKAGLVGDVEGQVQGYRLVVPWGVVIEEAAVMRRALFESANRVFRWLGGVP